MVVFISLFYFNFLKLKNRFFFFIVSIFIHFLIYSIPSQKCKFYAVVFEKFLYIFSITLFFQEIGITSKKI